MKNILKSAFTLAEVMIVLTVIGIISAIIMPIAVQNIPKKEIMLFKKGHNTLFQVVTTIVNDDKYHKDGDLGLRPNGTIINDDSTYFCHEFADVVSAKKVNCLKVTLNNTGDGTNHESCHANEGWKLTLGWPNEQFLSYFDHCCKENQTRVGEEIVTTDGVIYFEQCPESTFGIKYDFVRLFEPNNNIHSGGYSDFSTTYKVVCMDIDGLNKGEDPFGYGIRADGRIVNGARAQEWLEKGLSDD